MTTGWSAVGLFLVMCLTVPFALLAVARLLGVRAKTPSTLKARTYECGEEPIGSAWIQFHPRYFLVALFFVLFDVEVAFLFPWALVLRSVGVAALVGGGIFVAVLMLGWWYCVARGTLKWQ